MWFYRVILIAFVFSCRPDLAKSQLSPPGLGEAHDAAWLAIGLKQDLDTLQKWTSVTYIGLGRKSTPGNYIPLEKQAILVANQEFFCKFRPRWQASIALSYRSQSEYDALPPFDRSITPYKQELRFYARLSHEWKWNRFALSGTLRQELRKFYDPGFNRWHEDMQLRSRIRLKCTYKLNKTGSHRLTASGETLLNTKHETNQDWSDFRLNENRFCLYYSHTFEKLSLTVDVGYMNDLIGTTKPVSVHYLAFDFVILNPFTKKR